MKTMLENAKAAKLSAMLLDTNKKNAALLCMADKLIEHTDKILSGTVHSTVSRHSTLSSL